MLTVEWLKTSCVASRCGVHRDTVHHWIANGIRPGRQGVAIRLRAERMGGRWKIRPEWLREFLAAIRAGSQRE